MKKNSLKGVLLLLLTALIWGTSFVAQSVGMERVQAFTFNGVRTLMGAGILFPFVIVRDLLSHRSLPIKRRLRLAEKKKLLLPGAAMGLALFAAGNVQQFAFYDTTPGKIAFITALYMVFVPILGLFLGRRVRLPVWLSVALGVAGLYFLCVPKEGFASVNRGDLLALGCAVLFAVHILVIERFSALEDPVFLSMVQFTVAGSLALILAFVFETPRLSELRAVLGPLMYSGFMSCGVAYTLQVVGQKHVEPTVASLLMCLESVFGVLSAAVLLRQGLTGREIIGCAVMFAAILLSQAGDRLSLFSPRKNAQ